MKFNIGQRVVHKNFGVGIVESIEGINLTEDDQRLYYRVDFFNTTAWVPTDDQSVSALRPITPKSQLYRYRALLKSAPDTLDGNFYQRRSELERRAERGTFQSLCEVIRDLIALDVDKPLNYYEKTLYKKTREALVLEWSITSGMSQSETMGEIDSILECRK